MTLTVEDINEIERLLDVRQENYVRPGPFKELLKAYKELTRNPTPVVVGLVPVTTNAGVGVLCVRRGKNPGAGELALPGGYLEIETWQEGLCRELQEELSLQLDKSLFTLVDVRSGRNNTALVVFGLYSKRLLESELPVFEKNVEVTERVVLLTPQQLAFESHTSMVELFFKQLT